MIDFSANLSSPDVDVLPAVSTGMRLDVRIVSESGGSYIAVLAPTGKVLGSLTVGMPELLRCIQDGHRYQATVLEISGPIIRVHVRPHR